MRLSISLLSLIALPLCFVQARDTAQEKLVALAARGNGVIQLDAESLDILTSSKRNWSSSIQFTALDKRRRCTPCREFDPSWNAVAKAWAGVPKEHRDSHFFATLDFDNGQAIFQKLGLQSAPVVHIYPPTVGPRQPANGKSSPLKYDFSTGFEAGPLAEHLSHHTPIPIPYSAPIDWARWGTFATAALGFVLTLRHVQPILQNRWTWAAGTIVTSLVMTSGYMFTRIRGSPQSGGNGQWIAPGYQNQFGTETQVVAGIYGLLGAAFSMLILIAPYQTSPQRQRLQIYLWTTVIMIVYSILVSLFKVKNRGYPFSLLL